MILSPGFFFSNAWAIAFHEAASSAVPQKAKVMLLALPLPLELVVPQAPVAAATDTHSAAVRPRLRIPCTMSDLLGPFVVWLGLADRHCGLCSNGNGHLHRAVHVPVDDARVRGRCTPVDQEPFVFAAERGGPVQRARAVDHAQRGAVVAVLAHVHAPLADRDV